MISELMYSNDDGVTSVVGEIMLIALVLILVSLFAASAFDMLPGDRQTVVDVSLSSNMSEHLFLFWHKGGDWVDGSKLSATLTTAAGTKYVLAPVYLTDCYNETKLTFDLGGRYAVRVPPAVYGTGAASLRFMTDTSVIYAAEVVL